MNQLAPVEQQQPSNEAPTKLAMRSGGAVQALVPTSFEDVFRLGRVVAASGLAPKDMDTPETVTIAIMHGLEIGLPPMQALQRIAVINGRPTLWGDAAIGLVRASGKANSIKETVEGAADDRVAVCVVVRKDDPDSPIEGRFSVTDAKTAGLWGKSGPWQQFPERMLKMRARAFALRDGFADVLGGMYLSEELQGTEPGPSQQQTAPRPIANIPDIPDAPTVDVQANQPLLEPAQPELPVADPEQPSEQETTPEPQPEPLIAPEAYDGVIEDMRSRLCDALDAEILNEVWDEAQAVWEEVLAPDQAELNNAYNERLGAFEG